MSLRFGEFELDQERRQLLRSGHPVRLEPKAYELLSLLVERRPRALTRAQIRDVVWPGVFISESTLGVAVNAIRQALGDDAREPHFVRTVHGFGYAFCGEVRDEELVGSEGEAGTEVARPREPRGPDPGPSSFTEEDAGLFSGREAQVSDPRTGRRRRDTESGRSVQNEATEAGGAGITAPIPAVHSRRRPWAPVLGAAGLLAVVSVLGWWFASTGSGRGLGGPVEVTPFTSDGGMKRTPSFSPDGEKIAYSWNGPALDNWDIFVKALGPGASPLRLTAHPGADICPVWSPDGRQIAFMRVHEERAAIYTVPSLGGQERKVIDVDGPLRAGVYPTPALSWSPDGDRLAWVEKSGDAPSRIVQLSLAAREKQALTSPPEGIAGDLHPSFSPDGTLLAFVRVGDSKLGKLDVWIQPVDGGPPRRLTFGDYEFCRHLTWTPAGDEVVFTIASEGVFGLTRRVSLEGGDPRPIPELGVNASSASVRGARMVYTLFEGEQQDIWRIPGRKATFADRPPEKLLDSSMEDFNASYSPDGRKIAFQSMRSGTSNIWMSNGDGSDPVQLTSFEVLTGTPRWSPDGRTIAFDSRHAENYDLYVVDSEGGRPRRLTRDPCSDSRPSFSRDGQWIYFVSDRDGSFQIWKLPAGGGAAIQVTREGGHCATESWDGRYLYYGKPEYRSAIWRVPAGGGPETEVIAGPLYHCFDWSLVEDGIYYATTRGLGREPEYTIQFFDFESGQSTEVFRKTGPFYHWTVTASPDEEWVLYGESPFETSELILVENFR